jgi:hypothetical protein
VYLARWVVGRRAAETVVAAARVVALRVVGVGATEDGQVARVEVRAAVRVEALRVAVRAAVAMVVAVSSPTAGRAGVAAVVAAAMVVGARAAVG